MGVKILHRVQELAEIVCCVKRIGINWIQVRDGVAIRLLDVIERARLSVRNVVRNIGFGNEPATFEVSLTVTCKVARGIVLGVVAVPDSSPDVTAQHRLDVPGNAFVALVHAIDAKT